MGRTNGVLKGNQHLFCPIGDLAWGNGRGYIDAVPGPGGRFNRGGWQVPETSRAGVVTERSSDTTESTGRRGVRLLADHGRPEFFPGVRRRIKLNATLERLLRRLPGGNALAEVAWGLECWFVSLASPRDLPIVTVGYGRGMVFTYLQYCFRWLFRPRTQVMFDLLLDHPCISGWGAIYERFKVRAFNRVVDRAVIWGEADIPRYAEGHGLQRHRLQFHPFHITLDGYEFEIGDDGYIFAGGNAARDYPTLIEALKGIDYPAFVATTRPEVPPLAHGYPHITVRGVTPAEFRRKMARSTLVVECHDVGFFRTGGHQTFLNAFWMGKTFVMADRASAVGYFEDGDLGFVVDHGDVERLKARIRQLLEDPDLRSRMAERAQRYARQPRYAGSVSMQSIYNVAIKIDSKRWGYDFAARAIDRY